ncbi:MAG: hypothetical protein AEth_01015 [Candidatus Argoarchaeum ethanivorans]|uniref:Essential protein Yae1 N-terminal domain-containing protein n=1 Tax=Candidatus Argoarchaeum ethanivorans TaxID=2608793 RepID=A0A8B3S4I6_9EURY|nr:MAG: hypothetical protein AEth_01015 [Candidatus Argoarchaeum ethanivorans]
MAVEDSVIDIILDSYHDYYNQITDDIVSGVREGVEEGVREGVRSGVLEGLSESLDLGFLKISKKTPKELEDILRAAAVDEARKQVKQAVKSEICPVLQEQLRNLCESALDEIKGHGIRGNAGTVEEIKKLDISGLAGNKKAEVEQRIKEHLPQSSIFAPLFDEVQNAIYECIAENVSSCEKRMQDVAQGKITV